MVRQTVSAVKQVENVEFQLSVRVNPNSSRQKTVWKGDFLKVNLTSPPEGGRANQELVELIASQFHLDPTDVELTRGETSSRKEFTLHGLDRETLVRTISRMNE